MKSCLILASVLASATAFTTSTTKSSGSSSLKSMSDDFGAMAPLGYFDPLGLTKDGNEEKTTHLREVEVRHGRCAMLAVVGWLTTASGARLPGMEDMNFGFKAFTDIDTLPAEIRGTLPLTLGVVWALTFTMQDLNGDSAFPGDYRNGLIDFGWDQYDEAWKTKKRQIELNNGRAAQMGILGIMVHEQLGNLNDIGLPQP